VVAADGSGNVTYSGTTTFSGNATFNAGLVPSSSFLRNRIINGDMRIDQRNAGASVTLDAGGLYTIDRFRGYEDTDGAMTAQRVTTAPTGFVNSLQFTTTTADASLSALQYCIMEQVIEGSNISDLGWGTASAQTVTLSFWVRSSLTGTFGGVLKNSAGNRSYPYTYSISAANTWEYKTVTIPGDTSGTWLTDTGIGIRVQFGLGVGSTYSGTAGAWASSNFVSATGAVSVIGTLNATWLLTGAQLEVGSVATPFERRQFGQELDLCQRYFQHVPFSMSFSAAGGGNVLQIQTPFQVQMRAVPSFSALGADPNSTQIVVNNSANAFNSTYSSVNSGFASLVAAAAGTCQVIGYRSAASSEL
jgi:hypothetical protein